MKRTLVFDLETDGLIPVATKIHCIVIYDMESDTYHIFDAEHAPIIAGLRMLSEAPVLCGHNIIAFDIPVIRKLYPWFTHNKVVDTIIMARLCEPDIKEEDYARFRAGTYPPQLINSHSLKAWGARLGTLKGSYCEHTDWQTWSPQMTEYCKQDVVVTKTLYHYLKAKPMSQSALELEHAVAQVLARQEQKGVLFDIAAAEELYIRLRSEREKLRGALKKVFEPWYAPQTKDAVFIPKVTRNGYTANAPCTKIKLVSFNPSSCLHIAYNLHKKYGWKPTEFTTKSLEPKITEDILRPLPYPEAAALVEYMTLDKRCGQIAEGAQAWLKACDPHTGRIHGAINTIGAVTRRMTHYNPNLAQVPASYSPFGTECRQLFRAPNGYKLVGCDAEGLEARCLAHYLAAYDNGAFAKVVIEGNKKDGTDIHTLNMRALGGICKDRDTAKGYFYAWLYGAGDEKLARVLQCSVHKAKIAKASFLRSFPALKQLREAIINKVRAKGVLTSLDGHQLKVRSEHSALNTLLQSAGAIVMKRALLIADEKLKAENLDYEFVLNIHDELQAEVLEEHAERAGMIMATAIRLAGEYYQLRCQLAGEYKVGNTWADTH